MKSSKNQSKAIVRILILPFILLTILLLQSFTGEIKKSTPKTTVKVNSVSAGIATDEILNREKEWAAALVADDLETVSSIMHRDFRLKRVYSEEPPISKEMYLGMEGMSVSVAEVTSVTITEVAGPIIVARVTWSMDWEQQGVGKLPSHFDMIDTWIKNDDDTWHVLARVSQIADGPNRTRH